jgi:hypothetical protein
MVGEEWLGQAFHVEVASLEVLHDHQEQLE